MKYLPSFPYWTLGQQRLGRFGESFSPSNKMCRLTLQQLMYIVSLGTGDMRSVYLAS